MKRTIELSRARGGLMYALAVAVFCLTVGWDAQAVEPGTSPGQQKIVTISGLSVSLRWCPSGTFWMGTPTNQSPRDPDELQHQVQLSGFWIGETEVTQELWVKVMGYNRATWQDNPFRPIGNVSWFECMDFLKKINDANPNLNAIMPSEAQWEYACRAGTSTPLYYGDGACTEANLDQIAWWGMSRVGSMSHPVKQKKPNAWFLYDMIGNVYEWCTDWYGPYPDYLQRDPLGVPYTGPNTWPVVRGGAYEVPDFNMSMLRSAGRFGPPHITWTGANHTYKHDDLGFRFVVIPTSVPLPAGQFAGHRIIAPISGKKIPMRWCPAGTFMMGSPTSETPRDNVNETLHQVTLTQGFWFSETEVTQEVWLSIMGTNPSRFTGDLQRPVENLSWGEVQNFLDKINNQNPGLGAKFATEAQWEYACRAGTSKALPNPPNGAECTWENSMVVGWSGANSGYVTHPVGMLAANNWGIYDVIGNVYEWTYDWYQEQLGSGAVTDPTGPASPIPNRDCDDWSSYRGSGYNEITYPNQQWPNTQLVNLRSATRPWFWWPCPRGTWKYEDLGVRFIINVSER